jgi:hypothetical protein
MMKCDPDSIKQTVVDAPHITEPRTKTDFDALGVSLERLRAAYAQRRDEIGRLQVSNAAKQDQIDTLKSSVEEWRQAASVEAGLRREAHAPHSRMKWELDRLRKLLGDHVWTCKYRSSGVGGGDPQECSWPQCGCDPAANRVLDHLSECGFEIVKERRTQPAPVMAQDDQKPGQA